MMAIASKGHLGMYALMCYMHIVNEAHFLTHIPHPIHRNSEMNAILSLGFTSMHNFPTWTLRARLYGRTSRILTHFYHRTRLHTKYVISCRAHWILKVELQRTFLHSCAHRFGLHLLESTIAILVILSDMMVEVVLNKLEKWDSFWLLNYVTISADSSTAGGTASSRWLDLTWLDSLSNSFLVFANSISGFQKWQRKGETRSPRERRKEAVETRRNQR